MRLNIFFVFLLEIKYDVTVWTLQDDLLPPRHSGSIRSCALSGGGADDGEDYYWLGISIDARRQRNKYNPQSSLPNMKRGPKKNKTYNPSTGYEPYWPEGVWYQEEAPPPDQEKDVCGGKCNDIYVRYGKICAKKDNTYKTFKNYCEIQRNNCDSKNMAGKGWLMIYRGDCLGELARFPGYSLYGIEGRASNFMNNFKNKYGTKRTPPSTPSPPPTTVRTNPTGTVAG